MELILTILSVITLLGFTISPFFIKNFLSKYMDEKGKNLATKEDIGIITEKTEEVKILFQKEIAEYTTDLSFTNDYAFKRYATLYSKLYTIVIQSEYLRYFHGEFKNPQFNDNVEFPFFETKRTRRETKVSWSTGESSTKTFSLDNEMTSFNKKQLVDYIIENGEYASPRLLKLAVAYRYVWYNYSGTASMMDKKLQERFDTAELKLLYELVSTILQEYNEMRKVVKLSYSEYELENGRMDISDFK